MDAEIFVRPAQEADRRPLALMFAAVADERTGIATEPPVNVDRVAENWKLDGTLVAADRRGRGVGSALVAAAIDWARAHDLHKLALGVFPHNEPAIALYRKFGFVEEGRLVRHIRRSDGQLWDLIEMGLPL